jgi:hypothetical protein
MFLIGAPVGLGGLVGRSGIWYGEPVLAHSVLGGGMVIVL